ncbi:MAG: carbohydrate ABC transporter permease [Planctomycetes bacterium]|nr:carbohydrate ABC transporter permease [Planctomycetota bacterium]
MTKQIGKYIFIILVTILVVFPVVWLISTSIKYPVDIFAVPPDLVPPEPTLEHYSVLFLEMNFLEYIRNSAIVAVSTVIVAVVIGTLAAYSLARFKLPRNFNTHLSFWVLSTRMFPPIVTIIPLFSMLRVFNLINTRAGLVIAYTAFNLPFVVWMMRGFFIEIPKDLEEAAMVDGASRMAAFFWIIIPIAKPGLIATAIFTLIMSWNEFLFALILSQTRVAATLPIGVASRVTQYEILWGQMSASGVIALTPVLLFAFLVQKHLVRGMSMGAVKG